MIKEAMKLALALEALIAATPVKAKDPQMQADAIVALREALAEQPAPVQEKAPACYKHGDEPKRGCSWCDKRPAQQELVAWQYRDARDDGTWGAWLGCNKRLAEDKYRQVRPLYTSPPTLSLAQRKPLPCETLRELWCDASLANSGSGWFVVSEAFARAIEAAHGIKGDA